MESIIKPKNVKIRTYPDAISTIEQECQNLTTWWERQELNPDDIRLGAMKMSFMYLFLAAQKLYLFN